MNDTYANALSVRTDYTLNGVCYPLALLKETVGGWMLWLLRENELLGRVVWVAMKMDGTGIVGPVRTVEAHLVQLDPPRPGSPVELVMALTRDAANTNHSDYLILESGHQPEPGSKILGRMGAWRQADG